MAAHESASMAALRRNGRAVWPGMTIYGVGDEDHQDQVSDHNPDDTPGVRPGQTDADTEQEWRALDFMLGPAFTATQAARLVTALTTVASSRSRLFYVIYRDRIYRRSNGFAPQDHTGTFHGDHVHVSGLAADDENGADWPAVLALGGAMALETDLNAYVAEYDGGDDTSAPQRAVRASWRLMVTGSEHPQGTSGELAALAGMLAAMDAKLDQIIAALPSGGTPTGGSGTFTFTVNG